MNSEGQMFPAILFLGKCPIILLQKYSRCYPVFGQNFVKPGCFCPLFDPFIQFPEAVSFRNYCRYSSCMVEVYLDNLIAGQWLHQCLELFSNGKVSLSFSNMERLSSKGLGLGCPTSLLLFGRAPLASTTSAIPSGPCYLIGKSWSLLLNRVWHVKHTYLLLVSVYVWSSV